jgi:ribosomal protein S12 methylthiotransferase accessory factor
LHDSADRALAVCHSRTRSCKWYASPYTGLFAESGPAPLRAYDPDVQIWSGLAPLPGPGGEPPASGGAGWDEASAEAACIGEAIERWQSWPLPCDQVTHASLRNWPLMEPAIAPERWVLFHTEQYALPGFPYQPFTADSVCRWVCCRQAFSGLPVWVPEELVYLSLPPGRYAQLCPLVSSGLACGQWGQPVLLRGLQEVIERDAVVGAAWGCYPLEEHEPVRIFTSLDPSLPARLLRPNLRYRFYRIDTPFSAHVTAVTLEGEEREGYCFSVGAACRETRSASWEKALLETVQGRHYVRFLKSRRRSGDGLDVPASFADHALYYSLYPERLSATVLGRPGKRGSDADVDHFEDLSCLAERLGADRPVLFRNLTPPGIAMERLGWYVLRVLVPGLQPLHGHHALPFLGGPLWAPRGWKDWASMLPHPFP